MFWMGSSFTNILGFHPTQKTLWTRTLFGRTKGGFSKVVLWFWNLFLTFKGLERMFKDGEPNNHFTFFLTVYCYKKLIGIIHTIHGSNIDKFTINCGFPLLFEKRSWLPTLQITMGGWSDQLGRVCVCLWGAHLYICPHVKLFDHQNYLWNWMCPSCLCIGSSRVG